MDQTLTETLTEAGVIAKACTAQKAREMAGAGIGAVEMSDLSELRATREACPSLLIGYTGTDLAGAKESGADYVRGCFSCGSEYKEAAEIGIDVIASVATPAEAVKAARLGAALLDFSPADAAGGIAMLGALSVAVPETKFIVSGAAEPMNYTAIPACVGWVDESICPSEDTAAAAKNAMYASLGLTLAHIGINGENEEEAIAVSAAYADLFGIRQKTGNSSCFAGSWVEVMKKPYLGTHGHIAIGTKSLPRAIAFFRRVGVKFNESTRKPVAIYFDGEIGGFAIHLVQK